VLIEMDSAASCSLRMSSKRSRRYRYPAVLLVGLIGAGGQSASAGQGGWTFEVTPYLFAAGLNGTAGARGIEADVDASFSDIWDNLDIGLMGLFEARNGPWSVTFDALYFEVSDQASKTVTGPLGQVTVNGALDVSSSVTVLQPSAWYRVLDERTKVDLGAGLRYTRLSLDLEVGITTDPGIIFPGGGRSVSGSESWVDMIVGARVSHPISDRWSLTGYADVGGGGSSLTYQLVAGADWALNDRFTARAGYRYSYWDYEDGGTVWDMSASGLYLGLGIAF
jgi:opacity protein-like surface antigen